MGWTIGNQSYSVPNMWIYCKHQQCKNIHKAWLCSTALVPALPSDTVIIKSSDFLCCNRTKNSTTKVDPAALSALQRTKYQFHPITSEASKVSAPQLHILLLVTLAGHLLTPGATLRSCLRSSRESLRVFLGSPGMVGSLGITRERNFKIQKEDNWDYNFFAKWGRLWKHVTNFLEMTILQLLR